MRTTAPIGMVLSFDMQQRYFFAEDCSSVEILVASRETGELPASLARLGRRTARLI